MKHHFCSSSFRRFLALSGIVQCSPLLLAAGLTATGLRTEYLENPLGIDATPPRLTWRVESDERGQRQTACRIIVASTEAGARAGEGDLWDSGILQSDQTVNLPYSGRPLESRQQCFWRVRAWDRDGRPSDWSEVAHWSMGLLNPKDWSAEWIAYRDEEPLHTSREKLHLPPARHYRHRFEVPTSMRVRRATLYFSALGLAECHLNGQRVGDAYFESGWADYRQRAYYRTHDVTKLVRDGENCLGAIVADGWYAGYVGYGLLVGQGPFASGRNMYGKTPALLAQLEIEYADGHKQVIETGGDWEVSHDGPMREADMIMGEAHDARLDDPDWCQPGGGGKWAWEPAVLASVNGRVPAVLHDNLGTREVDLGFKAPPKLQAYSAPPIRITEELPARALTEPADGVFIFDLGQNIAGIVRLRVKGEAGTLLKLRYGEMLHPDGRLMTENLRRARATDFYTLRGDPEGEDWQPRFTYHGFRYVEVSGLAVEPGLEAVTGLALHNDTPLTGEFACSDEVMTRFWKNTQWTQRANFIEVPTDCPQRDERFGWMGDAQIYIGTAGCNADVAAFFTKWLDDLEEAQLPYGAYPDYCPYPMGHGTPGKNFGTAWTDAGIICPWTVWQLYGDTTVIERHWASMTRFMEWRRATTTPEGLGVSIGNPWGDWLNVNETTPIEFIDTCYHAQDCRMMAEMAGAVGRVTEARNCRQRLKSIQDAFQKEYLDEDGALTVDTQTAHVLVLDMGMVAPARRAGIAARLAEKIAENDHRMATGFLGTKPLLPVLSANGYHDLAVRLFQSRRFPSWGYEVVNGATTVWERWDSYTVEHGFNGQSGNQNASMNSFSHYSFGAVAEWMFRELAGIRSDGPGFKRLLLCPSMPTPESNPDVEPVRWARARQDSLRGRIASEWRRERERVIYRVAVPANVTATVLLPTADPHNVTEGGRSLGEVEEVTYLGMRAGRVALGIGSGDYRFEFQAGE